jgi:hypothetical protein
MLVVAFLTGSYSSNELSFLSSAIIASDGNLYRSWLYQVCSIEYQGSERLSTGLLRLVSALVQSDVCMGFQLWLRLRESSLEPEYPGISDFILTLLDRRDLISASGLIV